MRNSENNTFSNESLAQSEEDMPLSVSTMSEAESLIHEANTKRDKAHLPSQVVSSSADAAFG